MEEDYEDLNSKTREPNIPNGGRTSYASIGRTMVSINPGDGQGKVSEKIDNSVTDM